MKENNKQVIFYSAEKDRFLKSYKDRETLVFEATLKTTSVFMDLCFQRNINKK